MTHEPECPEPRCEFDDCDMCRCDCDGYRAAYRRGREDGLRPVFELLAYWETVHPENAYLPMEDCYNHAKNDLLVVRGLCQVLREVLGDGEQK